MKKLIVLFVIGAVIIGGYAYIHKYVRAPISAFKGETVETRRGDLLIPITASGHIRPASVTNIKGKASGEIVEIPHEVGAMVRQGELIVRLDETDELRNKQRAEADFQRAKIAWEQAQVREQEAETVGIPLAAAELAQLKAQQTLAQIDFDKQEELRARGDLKMASEMEYQMSLANLQKANAAVAAATVKVQQAKLAASLAEHEVDAAEESKNAAGRILEEAERRFEETKIYSPLNGMIVEKHVQEGEVVQSGKTSLTGGTVLMQIADISDIYAEVNVDEADIGMVRDLAPESALPGIRTSTRPETDSANEPELATMPEGVIDMGQTVEITVESYPEKTFEGKIERVSPQSEVMRAIATFKVWIRIVSDNKYLLERVINSQAQATFTSKSVTDAVLVDYEAMKPDPTQDGGYGVYVPTTGPDGEPGKPKFVPCKFGVDNRVEVQVIEGLDAGQKVYVKLPLRPEEDDD